MQSLSLRIFHFTFNETMVTTPIGPMFCALHTLSHLLPTTTLKGNYYYLHFTGGKTGLVLSSGMPKGYHECSGSHHLSPGLPGHKPELYQQTTLESHSH